MLKTTYEKWNDLKSKVESNNEYIAEYYLNSNSITRVYFSIEEKIQSIYIEFSSNSLADYNLPKLNGMEINKTMNKNISASKEYLKITNISNNEEIFFAFVSSLLDKIELSKSEYYVLEDVELTIKEFKKYFAHSSIKLTEAQEQGLCSELIELKNLINSYGEKIVLNWLGPNKNKRDFVFESSALEVKSTIKQINPSVEISNEIQLDNNYPENTELYLRIYILEKCELGLNVINLSKEILDAFTSLEYKKVFVAKLITCGLDFENYTPKYNYSIESSKLYKVTNEFPKITKNTIDSSIFAVTYNISINKLKEFEING